MRILFSVGFVVLCCLSGTAFAASADWTSTTSANLGGVTITMSGIDGSLDSADLTGSDFSAAPLSASTEVLDYKGADDWTANFSQSVSNLLLYGVFWRGQFGGSDPVTYTFDQPFTILSGFVDATVSGSVLSIPTSIGFNSGILQFGPLTSLSVVSSSVCDPDCSSQGMTFGLANPVPLPGALPLFASGLAGLGWLSRRRKRGQAATALANIPEVYELLWRGAAG